MKMPFLVLVFAAMLFSPLQTFAKEAQQHDVVLNEEPPADPGNDSEEIIEIPNRGSRMPARKIMCEISRENGVVIYQSGIADDIVSYEVYDTTGLTSQSSVTSSRSSTLSSPISQANISYVSEPRSTTIPELFTYNQRSFIFLIEFECKINKC